MPVDAEKTIEVFEACSFQLWEVLGEKLPENRLIVKSATGKLQAFNRERLELYTEEVKKLLAHPPGFEFSDELSSLRLAMWRLKLEANRDRSNQHFGGDRLAQDLGSEAQRTRKLKKFKLAPRGPHVRSKR